MMSEQSPPISEPLLSFDHVSGELGDVIGRVDGLLDRYRTLHTGGRIPENSIDALRVELTYHSNAIEGSTLSLRETQLVLEGLAPGGGKSLREIYEARNHDRALRMIERWASERGESELSEADVLAIHAQVMADIDSTSAGRFRTERVLIKGTRFVPPGSQKFGTLIPAMLEMSRRGGVHAVVRAAELHYNFVAIHPFVDGNGRTARLLMNLYLLQRGYPLTIIEIEKRGQYLAALEEANVGRAEPFARFVLNSVELSIHRLIGE